MLNTIEKTPEQVKKIRDTQKERNIKYRRKRNFIKKGCQFKKICGQDVVIFFYDKKMNFLKEFYTSSDCKFAQIK